MAQSFKRTLNRGVCSRIVIALLAVAGLVPHETMARASVEVRFYLRDSNALDVVQVGDSAKPAQMQEVRLLPGRRSRSIQWARDEPLILWRRLPTIDEAGGSDFEQIAQTRVPGADRVLVLLFPDVSSAIDPQRPVFHAVPMDDTAQAVPVDHLAFLNLTGRVMNGFVGENRLHVGPGLSAAVNLTGLLGRADVLVGLTADQDGAQKVVLENRLRFGLSQRTVIVVLPSKVSGSLAVDAFRLQEYVRPEPE